MTIALSVKNLKVSFSTLAGDVHAVRGIDLEVSHGEALAIVGESGCGKTQTVLAMMDLLDSNSKVSGYISVGGKENLLDLTNKELDKVRGKDIAMIFQNPMSSLHPSIRIGRQLTEGLIEHNKVSKEKAYKQAVDMLNKVGVPEPESRMKAYAHQLSGGLRQRVMIAMSLMCNPEVIFADEPTTALDVTIQAQILDLFAELRKDLSTALVMITHDLAVVAKMCDRIAVMYAGQIVESGTVREVLENPKHPYTLGLLHSTPRQNTKPGTMLYAISGQPPDLLNLPSGCSFQPRCRFAHDKCSQQPELTNEGSRQRACFADEKLVLDEHQKNLTKS